MQACTRFWQALKCQGVVRHKARDRIHVGEDFDIRHRRRVEAELCQMAQLRGAGDDIAIGRFNLIVALEERTLRLAFVRQQIGIGASGKR